MSLVNTVSIRGHRIEIFVNSVGNFHAEYNGQKISASTFDALKEKLERVVAQDRIEPIHFLEYENGVILRGKCTGIHYGNGNMIVVYEGQSGYQQPYSLDNVIALKHEEQYRKLCSDCAAADFARTEFEQKYGFDMKEAVREAIAAKAKARQ